MDSNSSHTKTQSGLCWDGHAHHYSTRDTVWSLLGNSCTFQAKLFLFWLLGLFRAARTEEHEPGEEAFPSKVLAAKASVSLQTPWGPSKPSGRPGRWIETKSKTSRLFCEKAAAENFIIKQDWKYLATRQGSLWSSASSNFLSRLDHKIQSIRLKLTGREPPIPVLWLRPPVRWACVALEKPVWGFCWHYREKKVLLKPEHSQWSTRNPYCHGAGADLSRTGQR